MSHHVQCKLFPDPHDEREPVGPCTCSQVCGCAKCFVPAHFLDMRMHLCSVCGNKRCPKATDHDLACTNSNEPGQKGSAYE